jgi:CRP/FNR family transcriptional regulator
VFRDRSLQIAQLEASADDLRDEERNASLLCTLSKRDASRGNSSREFNLSMSRRDIASNLRLATETISRVLARFQSAGIIRVNRKKVAILDSDKLKDLARRDTC